MRTVPQRHHLIHRWSQWQVPKLWSPEQIRLWGLCYSSSTLHHCLAKCIYHWTARESQDQNLTQRIPERASRLSATATAPHHLLYCRCCAVCCVAGDNPPRLLCRATFTLVLVRSDAIACASSRLDMLWTNVPAINLLEMTFFHSLLHCKHAHHASLSSAKWLVEKNALMRTGCCMSVLEL
jgi:hypothetical protein